MKYDGYEIGPYLRNMRKNKKLTVEGLSEKTGISVSAIKQIEQGGRNLSMKNLYIFMDVYEVDANTILKVNAKESINSVDEMLSELNAQQREYLIKLFIDMIEHAKQIA